MPYGFKIEYTDPATGLVTDITDKVSSFSITASRENYCREMTLEIADPDFYAGLELTRLPAATSVEIFTRVADTWFSQGRFFIERPALAHEVQSALSRGVWGRSETAALGEPFASKQSISVESDTTFFTLAEELVTAAGLTWDDANSDIDDFRVYAYTYARENAYPIDILNELAGFAGAFVTTSRTGAVRIAAVNYSPAAADITITDLEISRLSENPEWPEFGNRIRITPAGSLAGFGLSVSIPDECLPNDGQSSRMIYARLTDADGQPVDNAVISWSSDAEAATLDKTESNTASRLMPDETVRADNYYDIKVAFPPSEVVGVYAFADKTRSKNLAADGYNLAGSTITLAEPLRYCDQTVVVIYIAAGVAANQITAGSTAEDVSVTAEAEGTTATGKLYIGNACACPPSIDIEPMPDSIRVNRLAALIIYGEEAGPITTGRAVYLKKIDGENLGTISWGRARLGRVPIGKEPANVKNDVAGVSQVTVSRYIAAVSGVWLVNDDGNIISDDIYAGSFADKTIDLIGSIAPAAAVVVSYTILGAALAKFAAGSDPGTTEFKTWMRSNREAPVEDTATVRIEDDEDPYGDEGGDAEEEDGGVGGDADDDETETPSEGYCTDTTVCDEDESCCESDGKIGCFPPEECDSALPDPCQPANLSTDPEANRFEEPMENGCTCEEACESEFSTYGTTQTYDDGSYRPVSELVSDEIGHDASPSEYNEKYAELKEEALQECIDQCDVCGDVEEMAASDDNPETFDPPATFVVSFTGGLGPFTWKLSGVDGEMAAETTDDRDNSVTISDPDACGTATVSVTDSCGNSFSMGIRSTHGEWVEHDSGPQSECPITGEFEDNVLIKDGWKIYEELTGWQWSGSWAYVCDDWEPADNCGYHQDTTCRSPKPECPDEEDGPPNWDSDYMEHVYDFCCVYWDREWQAYANDYICGGHTAYQDVINRTIYKWSCPTE